MTSSSAPSNASTDPPGRWRVLVLLSLGELLAMTLWFSASAVVPQLTNEWSLGAAAQSWLTISVQLGFVAGALGSAALNLADRFAPRRFIAGCAVFGALCNVIIPLASPPLWIVYVLRFLTGMALAGVYPPGMKVLASWFQRGRGLAIGALVGALTIGSATPHLLNALSASLPGAMPRWEPTLYGASVMAAMGGMIILLFVRSGPLLKKATRFHWRHAGIIWTDRPVRYANFGYLGHMWELYAMWTWMPFLILTSYEAAGLSGASARVAGFIAFAAGGGGSLIAGVWADRAGRTMVSSVSLIISGACCLVAGALLGSPLLLTIVCVVWGFTVVADSAQFSAGVSELADARYVGTALTMQTCTGFLLSIATIQLMPIVGESFGWWWATVLLAPGPVFGVWSMWMLRRMPASVKMASGRR